MSKHDSNFLGGQSSRDAGRGASPQEEKQAMAGTAPASHSAKCNVDLGHPCDADDGEPCAECLAYLKEVAEEAWRQWQAMSPQERDPEKYLRDLRDAGRR